MRGKGLGAGPEAQKGSGHLLPPILELGPVCAPLYKGVNGGKGGINVMGQSGPSAPDSGVLLGMEQGPEMSG